MTPPSSTDDRPDPQVHPSGSAPIRIDRVVVDSIHAHVEEDTASESGGILVGNVEEGMTLITASIRAEHTVAHASSLTFTHDTWDAINVELDRDYPDSRIVGWYHSHPGFSVFLSEYDTFIQRNFFSAAWHVAYVVDPLLHEDGFFGWENEELVRFAEWDVRAVYGRSGAAVSEPATHRRPLVPAAPVRSRRLLPLLAVGAVGLIGGVLIGRTLADRPAVPPIVAHGVDVVRHDGLTVHREMSLSAGCLSIAVQIFNPTDTPVDHIVVVDPVPADLVAAVACGAKGPPVGPTFTSSLPALPVGQSSQFDYRITVPKDATAKSLVAWDQQRLALWQTLESQPPAIAPAPLQIQTGTTVAVPFQYPDGSAVSTTQVGDLMRGWTLRPTSLAALQNGKVVGKQPGVATIFTASGDPVLRVIVTRDVIESPSTTSVDTATNAGSTPSASSPETTE